MLPNVYNDKDTGTLKQYIAGGATPGGLALSVDGETQVPYLSRTTCWPPYDVRARENLLEVFVVSGSFAMGPGVSGPGAIMFSASSRGCDSTTFVMCDFYDYETQTTPLLIKLTHNTTFHYVQIGD